MTVLVLVIVLWERSTRGQGYRQAVNRQAEAQSDSLRSAPTLNTHTTIKTLLMPLVVRRTARSDRPSLDTPPHCTTISSHHNEHTTPRHTTSHHLTGSRQDVYGEKRITVDGPAGADGNPTKVEYRVWNPFRSKVSRMVSCDVVT